MAVDGQHVPMPRNRFFTSSENDRRVSPSSEMERRHRDRLIADAEVAGDGSGPELMPSIKSPSEQMQ